MSIYKMGFKEQLLCMTNISYGLEKKKKAYKQYFLVTIVRIDVSAKNKSSVTNSSLCLINVFQEVFLVRKIYQ